MYDESQKRKLKEDLEPSKPKFSWSSMSVPHLVECYDEIRRHLPPLTLKEMNLEEELLLQFHTLRALQTEVLNDEMQPLNQRVQLANAVSSNLTRLGELQESVYSSERFKKVENLLVRHLLKLDQAFAESFLSDYEAILKKSDQN